MAHCSFSINLCTSSSSFCCIIVANSSSLVIICSFLSRFCALSSSSCCSAKTRWAYMGISVLSSSGIEIVITACHYWWELIYHLFGTDLLRSIFGRQFQKVVLLILQQCGKYFFVIGGRSTHFKISGCDNEIMDGAQFKIKRKFWLVFYSFLLTCSETDYFRLSCEIFGWLTISKYQALKIFYCVHVGAIEGVLGEGESVSWGGAQTKGEVNKRGLIKNMFLHSDLLTSLSSSLTQLCFTNYKTHVAR